MAKIALNSDVASSSEHARIALGKAAARMLAQGDGWRVDELVCVSGPRDRAFEERHTCFHIAIVASGTFQYHSAAGRELMTPGSVLLGNAGQHFECGHEYGVGDRCVSFGYAPEYFERLAADSGLANSKAEFRTLRLPPLRWLSPLVAAACAGLTGFKRKSEEAPWEELNVRLASRVLEIASGMSPRTVSAGAGAEARVTRIVRMIDQNLDAKHALGNLAGDARLSPYHFLRTFRRITGVTPHQYLLRARLRQAALQLELERASVLDVAFNCGFGDVSNFNHAFRAEFGMNPRAYRFQERRNIWRERVAGT